VTCHLAPPRQSQSVRTSLNILRDRLVSPSSVARACYPSGGIKVARMLCECFWVWARCDTGRLAHPKLVVSGGALASLQTWSGRNGVRLASQSSEHCPLPTVGGFHRAANTVHFQRWEDNKSRCTLNPTQAQNLTKQTTIFFHFCPVLPLIFLCEKLRLTCFNFAYVSFWVSHLIYLCY
jgi:hypothetical protein